MIRWRIFFPVILSVLTGLSACARDDEAVLRARLNQWFVIGDLVYFKSHRTCTAAVFKLRLAQPRRDLAVQRTERDAKEAFRSATVAAFQIEGYAPHDLADALLLTGDGSFGKQVLAAAAQAVPCLERSNAEARLRTALTRKGATLAYDRESEGMMVLDPVARLVFYAAGDVW